MKEYRVRRKRSLALPTIEGNTDEKLCVSMIHGSGMVTFKVFAKNIVQNLL